MKKTQQVKNTIPIDFKSRFRWVKKANMFVRISAKDGKLIQEWFSKDDKPTL